MILAIVYKNESMYFKTVNHIYNIYASWICGLSIVCICSSEILMISGIKFVVALEFLYFDGVDRGGDVV